jgi:hypothetical protein
MRYGHPDYCSDIARRAAWIRQQEDLDALAAGYQPGPGARLSPRAAIRVAEARRIPRALDPEVALGELMSRDHPPSGPVQRRHYQDAEAAVEGLAVEGFAPVERPAEVGQVLYRHWRRGPHVN